MQNQALPSSDCHSGFVSSIVDGSLSNSKGATTWPSAFTPGLCKKRQLLCKEMLDTKEGSFIRLDCILEDL